MSKPYGLPQVEEQTVLDELEIQEVGPEDYPRFQSLFRRHHYLPGIKPVGERLYYVARWRGQWLAIAFGVMPSPQTLPIRFTRRKIVHPLISAHAIHASMARFTQPGTGTVRMCFPLPIRSATTQCSCRIWKSSALRPASSARRNPQPTSTARIA